MNYTLKVYYSQSPLIDIEELLIAYIIEINYFHRLVYLEIDIGPKK